MFLLKAQKYRQEMEGNKLARKPALGKGLEALFAEGEFSTEIKNEAVEAEIDIRSDLDIDDETDLESSVKQPETSVSAETSAEVSVPDASDGLPAGDVPADDMPPLEVSDLASGDAAVDDLQIDDLPLDDLSVDDVSVSDVASDDLPVNDVASDDVPLDDVSVSDVASDDLSVDDVPLDDLMVDDLPVDDLPVDDLPVNDLSVDDLPVDDLPVNGAAEPVVEVVDSVEAPVAEAAEPVEAASSLRQAQGADEDLLAEGAVLENNFVVQLAIDRLVPNPGQPRKNFDETELGELADSIKEHGVIMPIIAADTGDEHYTIIAGERRTRAARLAGLEEVPVIIRNYTDQKRMEISLIENIQRSDLNPIEEATAYKNLMDFSSLSHEELAARVGKNRSTVTNALRLLKLSAEVQKSLETGELSAGHARALLSVTDDKLRDKLFKEITSKGLSVREAEKKASALNTAGEDDNAAEGGGAAKGGDASGVEKEKAKRPPEITEMEEKFIEKLGTKVSIAGGLEKGLIRIEYYSMDDLDRLYGLLGGK